jgi:cell division protein FtsZ
LARPKAEVLAPLPPQGLPQELARPVVAAPTFAEAKSLPRDILIAKAKAFREQQQQPPRAEAEQLSMLNEEAESARRDDVRSPFDSENLDVPAYLRRQMESDRSL